MTIEGTIRPSTIGGEYEVFQDGMWKLIEISYVGDSEPVKQSTNVDEFYTALKAKMTGQVINGVLAGCLLESELKEVYEQYRQSITNSARESDD